MHLTLDVTCSCRVYRYLPRFFFISIELENRTNAYLELLPSLLFIPAKLSVIHLRGSFSLVPAWEQRDRRAIPFPVVIVVALHPVPDSTMCSLASSNARGDIAHSRALSFSRIRVYIREWTCDSYAYMKYIRVSIVAYTFIYIHVLYISIYTYIYPYTVGRYAYIGGTDAR